MPRGQIAEASWLRRHFRDTVELLGISLDQPFLARAYIRGVQRIRALNVLNPALKRVAAADAVVAREAAKMCEQQLDICSLVTRWKAAGWTRAAETRMFFEPYRSAGVDVAGVKRAQREVIGVSLAGLGLGSRDALAISGSAGFFEF